ncbi:MAG: Endoglucanase precursor [Firmicutes bacterium ADurb.Bin193]|nr:MAG: Endoglucanase precursor [Firmicutes bacterium ADurb.Bin193]
MKKRLLGKLLSIILAVSFIAGVYLAPASVMAKGLESLTISYSDVITLIGDLGEKITGIHDTQDRVDLFYMFSDWLKSDFGINLLIDMILYAGYGESDIPEQVQLFLEENEQKIIFFLCFIKSIDEDARETALSAFSNKDEYSSTKLTQSREAALNDMYEKLVDEDVRFLLSEEHGINAKVLLNLFSCIKGSFVLTNDENDTNKLAYKANSIDSDFEDRLEANMSEYFSAINDEPTSSAIGIINAIVGAVNEGASDSDIARYKKILTAIDMYDGIEPGYNVTYDLNGGSGTAPTQDPVSEGATFTVASAEGITAPEGKQFKEWNTEADGSGTSYNPGDTITMGTSDITLYAIWEDKPEKTTSGGGGTKFTFTNPNITGGGTGIPVIPAPVIDAEAITIVKRFNDVGTHWSTGYVAALVKKEIFKGYEDGTFKPDQSITREEIAVAMVRALNLESKLEQAGQPQFADNAAIADWSKKSVALLTQMGILKGYDDGEFKPKKFITRQEFSAILARSITKTPQDVELQFTDKAQISDWAVDSVKKVYALGIVKGYEDNTFRPTNNITRAEAATMLYNFMYTENLF